MATIFYTSPGKSYVLTGANACDVMYTDPSDSTEHLLVSLTSGGQISFTAVTNSVTVSDDTACIVQLDPAAVAAGITGA